MKEKVLKLLVIILAVLMLLSELPTVASRFKNEAQNNHVAVSLLYNDMRNKMSRNELETQLDEYRKIGVNTVSLMEEDLNQMVSRGYVTSISYGSLLHKYDDESMELAKLLEDNTSIQYNSYVIITKREETKDFLDKWMPLKYSKNEYCKVQSADQTTDMYCIYDGSLKNYEIVFGYNEEDIKKISDRGYDICLVFKIKNYQTDGYLDELSRIVREYPVKYINIKDDFRHPEKESDAKKHYEGIKNLIAQNNLTLVVTENADQLGNQEPVGYQEIFEANEAHVMRAFETYDCSNMDETGYMFRYYQYLNSTVDRNIRFITVTQILDDKKDETTLGRDTMKAVDAYMTEIQKLGYRIDGESPDFQYPDLGRLPYSAAAVLMILMLLVMVELLAERFMPKLTVLALGLAVLSVPVTKFVMPQSLIGLYATAWAALMPSFAIVTTLYLFKRIKDRLPTVPLAILTVLVMVAQMAVGGLVQVAQLSGISYYVNNLYFRGIKLSLFFPLLVGAIAYYALFVHKDRNVYRDLINIVTAEIKVYWVLLALLLAGIGYYYILRSGNVNTISPIEQLMRTRITDMFTARPRTKEFLIGYPALTLFVYYIKKGHKAISWVLAVGGSILAASISNTFCHVFTGAATIYLRVVNGLLIGMVVCILVYAFNAIVYRLIKKAVDLFQSRADMN